MSNDKLLEGLNEEQIEKVHACKSSDELMALARQEGVELTEEQLQAVSGGCGTNSKKDEEVDLNEKRPNTNPF